MLSQRTNANTSLLNYDEAVVEGDLRSEHGLDEGRYSRWIGPHTQKDDAGRGGETRPERQLAEVLVTRNEDPIVGHRPRKDVYVVGRRTVLGDPANIVASFAEQLDGKARHVLIGEEPHSA